MIIETKKGTIKISIVNNKTIIKTEHKDTLLFSEQWFLSPKNKIKSNNMISLFEGKGNLIGVSLEFSEGLLFIISNEKLYEMNKEEIMGFIEESNIVDIVYDTGGIYKWY